MGYDFHFEYVHLYDQEVFAIILIGISAPLVLLAIILGLYDLFRKHFENNNLKPAFYSLLFLQATFRTLLVFWVYEGQRDNVIYFDLPALLLFASCSVVIVQIDKMGPLDLSSRRRRAVLFISNVISCLSSSMYYIFGVSTLPWQSMVLLAVMESFYLVVLIATIVWSFRDHWVARKLHGRNKIAAAFICCGFCLIIRMGLTVSVVFTSCIGNYSVSPAVPALIYYAVGECTFSYISLYIQYLLPRVATTDEATAIPLLQNIEAGKIRRSANLDYYVSDDEKSSFDSNQNSSSPRKYSIDSIDLSNSPTGESPIKSPDPKTLRESKVAKFTSLFEKSLNTTNVILHEVLGKGGSGAIVYRCTLREGPFSGGTFAVKIMKDCVPADLDALTNEVRVYQSLKHDHIVRFMGADLSSPRNEVRLFMEYIPLTLDDFIRKRNSIHKQYFTSMQIAKYMLQIISGLRVMHERSIIHRDLKTSNIFVVLSSQAEIASLKIGDFDVSTFLIRDKRGGGYHTANKGTDGFRAPEMVSRTLDKVLYDIEVDIWSVGMILFCFLTLQEPFENENRFERGWDVPPTLISDATGNPRYEKLIHIFEQCSSPKPSDRPTCVEIASLLQSVIASSK